MKKKRIIPCLDMKDGKVVKGVNFVGLKEVGDPVECAKNYDRQGADELCVLDISATNEGRKNKIEMVREIVKEIKIPVTVGGGIRTVEDAKEVLEAGATKVSINSAAVKNPSIIEELSKTFGKERIVVAIDTKKKENGSDTVVINGGTVDTGKDVILFAKECERLGAGELLITSMETDGCREGYDIELLKKVCDAVEIPVIASGGCGKKEDILEVFQKTGVNAALAASLFHFGELTVQEVKEYLRQEQMDI